MESVIKNINAYKKYKNLYYIGNRNKKHCVYKYMDLEAAIYCLKGNNIQFVEPTEWDDRYEIRFYNADYTNVIKSNLGNFPPKLYACCFTNNKASEAAWKLYSHSKVGLASRCIQFRIQLSKLRQELTKYAQKEDCQIYEGFINYSLTDYEIEHIHKKNNTLYQEIFNENFDLAGYLSLLLIKRQLFYHENEFRYFIIPKNGKINERKKIFPIINWGNIITDVYFNDCSDIEIEILKHYLDKNNIKTTPQRFDLYSNKTSNNIAIE